jgi:TetR/AcrR family transcriptional regulator, regulator of biofilm formation and stress response
MASNPTQERSRNRRDALLTAAIDLLAEGGPRAVTHRAVAAKAGLPVAATTYYFESIQQLTDAALARHVAGRVEELESIVARAVEVGRSAEEIGALIAVSLADRAPDVVIAQFEIYLEAARSDAMREPVRVALDKFESYAARVLALLGVPDPERAAPTFLALVDGFALHRLARPRPRELEIEALRRAMRALLVAEVMPAAEQDKWAQRLTEPLGESQQKPRRQTKRA